MKKVLIPMVIIIALCSCKKEIDTTPLVGPGVSVFFKKDSSVVDQTVQIPKNNHLLFSGVLNTGSVNGFQLASVEVTLKKGGDAASPKDYLRKIYFTIEDASGISYVSTIKDSVVTSAFTFDNFLKNYGQYKTLTIRLYADILSSATNNTGLQDDLSTSVKLFYTSGASATPAQTAVVDGQKITYSVVPQAFSVVSYADSTNPAGATMIENQTTDAIHYGVALLGQSGVITSHRLLVQGPAASAVSSVKLFSGGNLIAQAVVVNGVALLSTADVLSAGTRKFFSIVPVLSVTPATSNYDFTLVLDEVRAVSTVNEQKSDGSDQFGNAFTVLKTSLKIERIAIVSQVINDSTEEDTYQLRITNVGSFVASFAQISYGLTWANNSSGLDTLQLKPRLLCNNAPVSGFWTNQVGDTIAGGFFKESTTSMTFTFTTEYSIASGSSVIVLLKTFRKGFRHTNDGFKLHFIFDGVKVDVSYKYINQGTVGLSRKLFSSLTQTVSANPYKQLFLWSDNCDLAHSPVPSLSSKDWMNGYGYADLVDQVWVKP